LKIDSDSEDHLPSLQSMVIFYLNGVRCMYIQSLSSYLPRHPDGMTIL